MSEQSTKKLSFRENPLKCIQKPKIHNEIYDIHGNSECCDFQNIIQCLKGQSNKKDQTIINEREQNQAGEYNIQTNDGSDQGKQIQDLNRNSEQNDGDLTEYVNCFQCQENQKQNTTQEMQQENKCANNHLQFDLGNNTDKIEEQIINTKGFKAKKQPTLIKNMKKWRIKQSLKNKTLIQEEQLYNQQHTKQLCDTTKQIVNIQDIKSNHLKLQAETVDSNLSKFITKIEKYQKSNFNNHVNNTIKQQHAEKSISPIDSSQEDSIHNDKNNILSEIENDLQKPEMIYSTVKFSEQQKPSNQNLNGKILQSQQINGNAFQLIKNKFFLEKSLVRNQSIQILQKNQQSKMSSNSTLRSIKQILFSSSQSNADTQTKNNRSQSLNNKFSKKRNISMQILNNNNLQKGNQSQNVVQEYLQNYLNTADTNHLLLSSLNKGIIQPPPQAQQPETLFIPKVMTRNASFLKKGSNPTDNIINFQNSSHQFTKQSDSKYSNNNKANCKENASVPLSPSLNQQNHEVFQFNPSNISNSQRSLQNSQNFNFQKSLKSYLFYQNKFMGQKQHEFLMNNFKYLPKLNSLLNQPQSNMNNESNNQVVNNFSKGLIQKLNQSQSEKFISNKQNEQSQHQLQQDVSPKRVLVCSFTNQYSCQQQQKQKLNELKQKEAIKENDYNNGDDEIGLKQVTQESQQANFKELSNYYKLKYEQELQNKNFIPTQLSNQKAQKPYNILQNRILRKKNQSQDLRYSYYENEESKFSGLFKQSKYFNEEEIDLLKPWNIN
ncbi:hypothetical protein ABPG72_005200 [Tetrahymena utriculariae]